MSYVIISDPPDDYRHICTPYLINVLMDNYDHIDFTFLNLDIYIVDVSHDLDISMTEKLRSN